MAKTYESVVQLMDSWNDDENLDKAEVAIDEKLSDQQWLKARMAASSYARGQEQIYITVEDCWLSPEGCKALRKKYMEAGWGDVTVNNSAELGDKYGSLSVKLRHGVAPELPDTP